jgi:hypothetical protein
LGEAVQGRNVIGAEPECCFEQLSGAPGGLAARLHVEECGGPHGQIDGIGIVRSLAQATLTFCFNERDLQRGGNALCNLVLHSGKLRDLSHESFRPQL